MSDTVKDVIFYIGVVSNYVKENCCGLPGKAIADCGNGHYCCM